VELRVRGVLTRRPLSICGEALKQP